MKRGFTLIELLVVIAMLAILIGSIGTSVNQARRRALISKATQDCKEMTNAILAFENIAKDRSLEKYAGSWKTCTEGSLAMILGGEQTEGGEPSPVLYNAQLRGGTIYDPWGTPYEFMIKRVTEQNAVPSGISFVTAPILPNFYRLTDGERQ